ncbi:MAG: amidohydrolase [Oscillospiraceae bacterium]|jgi:predicted TIM-barrel fold metal-dependent hydrolase|nr:amidohydrolase [Oscillospiraceae bacterium]
MKIIDAHIHFFDLPHFHQLALAAGHENSAAHLKKTFGELGIEGAVVMGNRGLSPEDHVYPEFMRYCVGLDRFSFTGEVGADTVSKLRLHLNREACVGIKLYPGYNEAYVYDDVYKPVYRLAEEYGVPVAIHTGEVAGTHGRLKYCHPMTIDEVASDYPGVNFVMCHLGNPWVMDAAVILHKNPNVSADLSGMLVGNTDVKARLADMKGYIDHLKTWIAYAGAYDRLMYATDWPLANMKGYIDFVAELIPPPHHEAVFCENARRIYKLALKF